MRKQEAMQNDSAKSESSTSLGMHTASIALHLVWIEFGVPHIVSCFLNWPSLPVSHGLQPSGHGHGCGYAVAMAWPQTNATENDPVWPLADNERERLEPIKTPSAVDTVDTTLYVEAASVIEGLFDTLAIFQKWIQYHWKTWNGILQAVLAMSVLCFAISACCRSSRSLKASPRTSQLQFFLARSARMNIASCLPRESACLCVHEIIECLLH